MDLTPGLERRLAHTAGVRKQVLATRDQFATVARARLSAHHDQGDHSIETGAGSVDGYVDLVGPAARQQRQLCVRAFQSAVGCVEAQRGAISWSKPANGSVGLASDASAVYGVEANGRVMAWKAEGGDLLWQSDLLLNRGLSAPLAAGRSIAIGDGQGYVHLLAREDGKLLNRLTTDGSAIVSAPLLAGNNLLALTRKGALYAWRPE